MRMLIGSISTKSILKESILKESILSKVGGGDRWFEEEFLKKWGMDLTKVTWNEDGSIDYDGDVNLHNYDFTKFPIKFNKVSGLFNCCDCKNLLTLEGGPKEVGYGFYCKGCTSLLSLKGCPREIRGGFNCGGCNSLTNLEGSPKNVIGTYFCYECENLVSIEGCPQKVGGSFVCYRCGREFTEKEIREKCKVKGLIYL